jgi:hypothetical protein
MAGTCRSNFSRKDATFSVNEIQEQINRFELILRRPLTAGNPVKRQARFGGCLDELGWVALNKLHFSQFRPGARRGSFPGSSDRANTSLIESYRPPRTIFKRRGYRPAVNPVTAW